MFCFLTIVATVAFLSSIGAQTASPTTTPASFPIYTEIYNISKTCADDSAVATYSPLNFACQDVSSLNLGGGVEGMVVNCASNQDGYAPGSANTAYFYSTPNCTGFSLWNSGTGDCGCGIINGFTASGVGSFKVNCGGQPSFCNSTFKTRPSILLGIAITFFATFISFVGF